MKRRILLPSSSTKMFTGKYLDGREGKYSLSRKIIWTPGSHHFGRLFSLRARAALFFAQTICVHCTLSTIPPWFFNALYIYRMLLLINIATFNDNQLISRGKRIGMVYPCCLRLFFNPNSFLRQLEYID